MYYFLHSLCILVFIQSLSGGHVRLPRAGVVALSGSSQIFNLTAYALFALNNFLFGWFRIEKERAECFERDEQRRPTNDVWACIYILARKLRKPRFCQTQLSLCLLRQLPKLVIFGYGIFSVVAVFVTWFPRGHDWQLWMFIRIQSKHKSCLSPLLSNTGGARKKYHQQLQYVSHSETHIGCVRTILWVTSLWSISKKIAVKK